jgi:hypothetical protein
MSWRLACHLYVGLAALLSLATAAQAYLFDTASAYPTAQAPVLATLLLAGLTVTYAVAAAHAARRAGAPIL